ncbi:MAG: hypothetical protein NT007_02015 [Candidatus Kapabacteria bacterium]|nr:hypothetical protein [Candidatus Kapabacteria bacterium]
MRKAFYISVFLMLGFCNMNAQRFALLRTDVDTARANFVTATFSFGIDIKLDSIRKCLGFSFQIQYDQVNYIKFSNCKIIDFPKSSELVYINQADENSNTGTLYIAASPKNPKDTLGIDNPKTVHIEFTVSQTAPHLQNLNFQFLKSEAVVYTDSGRVRVKLPNSLFTYKIHGFINIYPGDADNNLMVDNQDFTTIIQFLGLGINTKASRSYRRQNASTLWFPQRVLAWDEVAATYADCDGNGRITTVDMLVARMNFKKIHSEAQKSKNETQSLNKTEHKSLLTSNSVLLPVYAECPMPFIGTAGTISYADLDNDFDVIGLSDGNMFKGNGNFLWYSISKDTKTIEFAYITDDDNAAAVKSGILLNLVAEPKAGSGTNNCLPKLLECTASNNVTMFPLNQITDVLETPASDAEYTVSDKGEYFEITLNNGIQSVESVNIYNLLGESIPTQINFSDNSNVIYINKIALSEARYFIKITTPEKIIRICL